jgi:transcriptional regulator of met regulon
MSDNRDASSSLRGYLYQMAIGIDLIVDNQINGNQCTFEKIEDVCIKKPDGNYLYQVKHHDDGVDDTDYVVLLKTILSDYDFYEKNNLAKIIFKIRTNKFNKLIGKMQKIFEWNDDSLTNMFLYYILLRLYGIVYKNHTQNESIDKYSKLLEVFGGNFILSDTHKDRLINDHKTHSKDICDTIMNAFNCNPQMNDSSDSDNDSDDINTDNTKSIMSETSIFSINGCRTIVPKLLQNGRDYLRKISFDMVPDYENLKIQIFNKFIDINKLPDRNSHIIVLSSIQSKLYSRIMDKQNDQKPINCSVFVATCIVEYNARKQEPIYLTSMKIQYKLTRLMIKDTGMSNKISASDFDIIMNSLANLDGDDINIKNNLGELIKLTCQLRYNIFRLCDKTDKNIINLDTSNSNYIASRRKHYKTNKLLKYLNMKLVKLFDQAAKPNEIQSEDEIKKYHGICHNILDYEYSNSSVNRRIQKLISPLLVNRIGEQTVIPTRNVTNCSNISSSVNKKSLVVRKGDRKRGNAPKSTGVRRKNKIQ